MCSRSCARRSPRSSDETLLTSPITTLTGSSARRAKPARLVLASSGPGRPGDLYPIAPELVEPMGWTLGDGVARYHASTGTRGGLWISAFAPILDTQGRALPRFCTWRTPVEIYLDRLHELRNTLLFASGVGALDHARAGTRRPPPPDSARSLS